MPDWWLMTMMMMTINYSRVCGRARDVLGKIARSKVLIVFKTELTESDCYIKDCTRWRKERGIFIAQFLCLSILDFLRNKKKLLLKLGWFVWGTEFSLKRKKSKRLLSIKHIVSKTTKNRSVWGTEFLPDVHFDPPLWKVASAVLGFHKLISVANSHHKNKFCTTDNVWSSKLLSSYHWY